MTSLVTRFLDLLVVATVLLLLIEALQHADGTVSGVRRALTRWQLLPREPEHPDGPPLEQLAAHLRRLYPDAHHPRRGLGMPKQRGIRLAYDQRLAETAQALGVATTLTGLPVDGVDREAERLRVELLLCDAGVVWQARRDWPGGQAV